MKKFIEWFKTTEFYNSLLNEHSPDLMFVGGSRGVGCNKLNSDYDIIVYSSNKNNNFYFSNENTGLIYEGCGVHAIVHSTEHILSIFNDIHNQPAMTWLYMGSIFLGTTLKENVIYSSAWGNNFKDFCIDHAKELCIEGAIGILKLYDVEYRYLLQHQQLINFASKVYWGLIVAYDSIFNTNHKDLIFKIRTRDISTLFQEDRDIILECLETLISFCASYEPNYKLYWMMEELSYGYTIQ